jgi:hypothetical protein
LKKLQNWMVITVALILIGVFVAYGFVPAWQSLNTDFVSYYLAARLDLQGSSLNHVYDYIWFQRQKDHEGIEKRIVPFNPLTLYSAMAIAPIASLSPLTAKRCWLVINLLLLGFAGFLLHRMTTLGLWPIAVLTFLAVGPLQAHFLFGQLHILVLVLLVLSLWLYLKDWPIVSGLLLALAAAVKIYPILFVFYYIRKKQWRVVAGLMGGVAVLSVLAVYLFGLEVNMIYVLQVLPRIMHGDSIDPYNLNWSSFTAVFHRLFLFEPELNPHPFTMLPLAYAVLQAITQALLWIPLLWLLTPGRASSAREMLEYAAYIASLLLLSTNPGTYHYVALIPCVVMGANFLVLNRRVSQLVLLILFYALACMPRLTVQSAMVRLLFTSAFFLLLLVVLSSLAEETWKKRLQSRSASFFLPLIIVIVSVSVLLDMRHVHAAGDYSVRVTTNPGSLMKTHPAISDGRIAFTMLQSPVYVIGMLSRNKLSTFAADTDMFHPAFIPGSPDALVELAGPVSKIVRVELDGPLANPERLQIVVENGEKPVISPDGQWLAYIREVQGRGGLWIKRLHPVETQDTAATTETQLVGSDYDVLEASFDGGSREIVFSAQPRGRTGGPSLYKTGLSPSAITQITFGAPSRYPAFSSDGAWMAYSILQRGSWQLQVKPLGSGTERQITAGECNSIYPAWMPDSRELVYVTDCGRGLSMTSLAQIRIAQ